MSEKIINKENREIIEKGKIINKEDREVTEKGKLIREIRKEKKIHALDICKAIGVSDASFYSMEIGKRGITPKVVKKLIVALGIDEKYKKFLLYPEEIMSVNKMTKGEFIRIKRLDCGLNKTELAKCLGVSVALLSCIEREKRNISEPMYSKMEKVLDLEKVPYKVFKEEDLKGNLIYRTDWKTKNPIIDGIYLKEETVKERMEQLKKDKYAWKIKKYEISSERKEC